MKSWQGIDPQGNSYYKEERVYTFASPIVSFVAVSEGIVNKELAMNKAFFDQNF